MFFSKVFEKNKAESNAKSESDFNYDNNHRFYKFYKRYDESEDMSLDSKYNRMKSFNKLLISFEGVKMKRPKTKLKKEWIMKNVNKL